MQMLSFKFQQNRTINEEFDFIEGGRRGKGTRLENYNLNDYW